MHHTHSSAVGRIRMSAVGRILMSAAAHTLAYHLSSCIEWNKLPALLALLARLRAKLFLVEDRVSSPARKLVFCVRLAAELESPVLSVLAVREPWWRSICNAFVVAPFVELAGVDSPLVPQAEGERKHFSWFLFACLVGDHRMLRAEAVVHILAEEDLKTRGKEKKCLFTQRPMQFFIALP